MQRWWMNQKIYDALPVVYIMLGFFASKFLPDNIGSFIGGVLFTITGILVYRMRTGNK